MYGRSCTCLLAISILICRQPLWSASLTTPIPRPNYHSSAHRVRLDLVCLDLFLFDLLRFDRLPFNLQSLNRSRPARL